MKILLKIRNVFLISLLCLSSVFITACNGQDPVGGGVEHPNSSAGATVPSEGTETNYTLENTPEKAYKNLPVIEINTQDEVLPFDKETYINCSFKMSNCSNEDYNFEVSMKDEYGDNDSVGIRLRGNSTQGLPKKPYRIKFDKKKSILNLPKNKSWVLLADYLDQSAIRNFSAFTLANLMGNLDFSPTPHHIVLFMNGYYQGLYLLCEQIDEKEGRTNVECDILGSEESFPFLLEMDRNALNEGVTGVDNFKPNYYYPIEIKYPEVEDRLEGETDIVFNYINEYINAVFTLLKQDVETVQVSFSDTPVSFEDLVDVDSFIEYYFVNEIMFNQDSTWGSIYLHKSKDGKLKFGPNWDFDWSMSDTYIGEPYKESFINCANEFCILKYDTPFRDYTKKSEENFKKLCSKWNEIKQHILNVVDILENYKMIIKNAAKFDANYWYGDTGAFQFDMQYDYVRLFLLDRYDFLEDQLLEDNFNEIFN